MEAFKTTATALFKSMGHCKEYNLRGEIIGDQIWNYPLVSGFPHWELKTSLHRAKQVCHVLDSAALLIKHWETCKKLLKTPKSGSLAQFTYAVSSCDTINPSEVSMHYLMDEVLTGSKSVMVIAMHSKEAKLSRTDKGPVAYFIQGDKSCVCVSVDVDSCWKGVKQLLEEENICKVFLNVAHDLPNMLLVSEALTANNIYCLTTQHKAISSLLNFDSTVHDLPQFHLHYGVRNVKILADSHTRVSTATVLRYCYNVKSIMKLWQQLYNNSPDVELFFCEGYNWNLFTVIAALTKDHRSLLPKETLTQTAGLVNRGQEMVVSLLSTAHVQLTYPDRNHQPRIKGLYEEIMNVMSVIRLSEALDTESSSKRQRFINSCVNFMILKTEPQESMEVGSMGDVYRRLKIVMPNFGQQFLFMDSDGSDTDTLLLSD